MMALGSDNITSTRRIHTLSEDVINQIAAGEVVERPSSVIKELVENSLDAGAHVIHVSLLSGGLEEMSVIDDGSGIHPDDLFLATTRHATSKMRQTQDLESIQSFGFRGEALASIASVAEVEIKSRMRGMDSGLSLKVSFGVNNPLMPVGTPEGTQISVRHLFQKLPARYKFLRSPTTEFSHCARLFKEIALGSPQVSFFLHHHGKQILSYTTPSRLSRFQEILKPSWTPLHFEAKHEEMQFEAFLSPPEFSTEKGNLYFFLNGRLIRNKVLYSTLRNAYQEYWGPHHEPSGVFYLDMRGDWVDVNVHPQKWEVRLLRTEKIYGWIISNLRKSLAPYKTKDLNSNSEDCEIARFNFSTQSLKYLGGSEDYQVCADPEGFLVFDSSTLSEKYYYDKLLPDLKTHPLPNPMVLSLSKEASLRLKTDAEALKSLGFDFEFYGEQDLNIKSLPEQLKTESLEKILTSTLSYPQPVPLRNRLAAALARIQPLDSLTNTGLNVGLNLMDENWKSLEGKPLMYRLSYSTLNPYFGRT